MSEDDDSDVPDLRDAQWMLTDDWSRRTWYGKLRVVVLEAPLVVILLAVMSLVKLLVYPVILIDENWPAVYKESEDGE